MGRALHALGMFCARWSLIVLGIWILVIGAVFGAVTLLGDETSNDLALPGTGSQEMKDLLEQLGEGAIELIPRSEASFIPDSVVGRVTLKVDGQEASFFFLADEEQAKQHGKALSAKAARSVEGLSRLHKRILHLD